jgi:hypothetical protein
VLKIYLLCVFVLLALPTPVFAVKVKKDSYVPLRVSKKRKVEASLTAKKKDTKRRTRTSSKLAGLHPKAQTKVQAALKESGPLSLAATAPRPSNVLSILALAAIIAV